MDSVWSLLDEKRREGKRILFEGAQGALLDIDHGTYPYVTSSNTVAAQAATGSGLGPGAIGYVLGICKAYTTRVGDGPFPTEQQNEIGKLLGERGREFGTVTGRPRRCGWFDAVLVRQTVRTSGINGLALTKLDILDGLTEIKVCVGYRLDGREIDYLPASEHAQARVEPIYETVGRLAGADRPGPVLGGTAGPGDQICAPDRGIGRLPGGPAVDQPGAGGHHSDAEPVREISGGNLQARTSKLGTMADYYPLISRAVAGLEKNTGENRRALYERARTALVAQLRGVNPPLPETDITRERLALEEAIRKVEAEAARQFDPVAFAIGRSRSRASPTAAARGGAARAGDAEPPPPSRPAPQMPRGRAADFDRWRATARRSPRRRSVPPRRFRAAPRRRFRGGRCRRHRRCRAAGTTMRCSSRRGPPSRPSRHRRATRCAAR